MLFSLTYAQNEYIAEEISFTHFGGGGINVDKFFEMGYKNYVIHNGIVCDKDNPTVCGYWYAYITGTGVFSNYTPNSGQYGRAIAVCGGLMHYGNWVASPNTSSASCTKGTSGNEARWEGSY